MVTLFGLPSETLGAVVGSINEDPHLLQRTHAQ